MKHKRKLRITSYCLLGAFLLWGIFPDLSPRNNVANLVQQAEKNSQLPHYQSDAGSLRFISNAGYVMALSVGDQPGFEPNQFITISQLQDKMIVEVIFAPGATGCRKLANSEADAMLKQLDFPTEALTSLMRQRTARLPATSR